MAAFVLLAVMAVALAAVSCVPDASWLYSSPLFVAGWVAVVTVSVTVMVRHHLWRKPSVLVLHAAFAVILSGAMVSHVRGSSQSLHLRVGETDFVGRNPVTLEYLKLSPQGIFSLLDVEGIDVPVKMNRMAACRGMQFVQIGYDDDCRGVTYLVTCDAAGVAVTYFGYAMLLLSMPFVLLRRRVWRVVVLAVIAVAVPAMLLTPWGDAAGRWWIAVRGMEPVWALRSPLLAVHVLCVMAAYTLLAIIACMGVAFMCGFRRFTDYGRAMLRPAVCLLAAGIFVGAVWANVSWGRYWGWDPKEVWALITMLVYCVPIHDRMLPVFRRDRFFAIYCTVAFITVLMTYFGVNFLLGGLHSYA